MADVFDVLRIGGDAPVACGDDGLCERFGMTWDGELMLFRGRLFSVTPGEDCKGPRAGEEFWVIGDAESGEVISSERLYRMWAVWSLLDGWCQALEKGKIEA